MCNTEPATSRLRGGLAQTGARLVRFIGTIELALQVRRERFGLSYLITPDHELPTLAAIIAGS